MVPQIVFRNARYPFSYQINNNNEITLYKMLIVVEKDTERLFVLEVGVKEM